jgi:hypothetical protein
VQNNAFSIQSDASVTNTGWQGLPPPDDVQRQMEERFRSGKILEDLTRFLMIPYERMPRYEAAFSSVKGCLRLKLVRSPQKEQSAFVLDRQQKVVLTRTHRQLWMLEGSNVRDLSKAMTQLLGHALEDETLRRAHAANNRGPHFPCIIGYQRQYRGVSFDRIAEPQSSNFQVLADSGADEMA